MALVIGAGVLNAMYWHDVQEEQEELGIVPPENHPHKDVNSDSNIYMPSPEEAYRNFVNSADKPDVDKLNRQIQKEAYGTDNNIGQTQEEALQDLTDPGMVAHDGALDSGKKKGLIDSIKSIFNKPEENQPDENGRIWVSHYTTKERAEAIMNSGKLMSGGWEGYLYVMEEPSTPEEAEKAGAKYFEAKVLFKVLETEIEGDRGLSDEQVLNAKMFLSSGPILLKNRAPRVEYPERKKGLLEKFKGLFNRNNSCEGK